MRKIASKTIPAYVQIWASMTWQPWLLSHKRQWYLLPLFLFSSLLLPFPAFVRSSSLSCCCCCCCCLLCPLCLSRRLEEALVKTTKYLNRISEEGMRRIELEAFLACKRREKKGEQWDGEEEERERRGMSWPAWDRSLTFFSKMVTFPKKNNIGQTLQWYFR